MRYVTGSKHDFGRYGALTFSLDGALDAARGLSDDLKRVQIAQKRAVATMLRRLRVEARRDIQREYSLRASTLTERLVVSRKFDGVALIGKATGIGLENFGASQNRKGVTYRVKKGEARQSVKGSAFMRRTRSGSGPYVWLRKDGEQYTHNTKDFAGVFGRHGYPIFKQYGPSVAQMLKHGDRPARLVEFAIGVLKAEQQRLLGSR